MLSAPIVIKVQEIAVHVVMDTIFPTKLVKVTIKNKYNKLY